MSHTSWDLTHAEAASTLSAISASVSLPVAGPFQQPVCGSLSVSYPANLPRISAAESPGAWSKPPPLFFRYMPPTS
eukprot:CAMPEP_0180155634 /NCGR_PEP_ID=MMETSP0986-20121125/24980_1 /TAXON_ID=697907 /ORGANISM="non described non described, Strain CCMP2293" /LENGTH=75 /DNA_ID=CAMNT_0022104435 /DNA_START=394 /DNA_END=617 /DNA_ORIENTATION=-